MINHGLSTGALVLLVGMLYERYHTRKMDEYGGMGSKLKLLSVFMVFICMSSVGLPGLNGFWGELSVLIGMYGAETLKSRPPVLAILATCGMVFSAQLYLLDAAAACVLRRSEGAASRRPRSRPRSQWPRSWRR